MSELDLSLTGDEAPEAAAEEKVRAKLAAEAFQFLGKAIKNIGIYLHNTVRHVEFLERPLQAIQQYGEAYGPLQVKVETTGLYYGKLLVFDESFQNDAIGYRFYRDGIRHLVFRPELTMEELQRFVGICMANLGSADFIGKDMLGLLWEAAFDNIEYVVVEGFSVDGVDDDEVEVEVDQIVGYLFNRLKSNSEDVLRFARLSAADLEMQLDGVDQIRGAVIAGQPCSTEKAAEIQEEIRHDIEERMLPKLVNVVFQTFEQSYEEIGAQAVREIVTQLLDAMLVQEDFASINHVVTKFKTLERDPARGADFTALKEHFIQRMGDEERLRKIGEILRTSRPPNIKDVFRYLFALDQSAIVALLDILETIELQENREVICDALVALGRDNPDPFLHRLDSDKSQLVRDMIYVIDRIDFPDKVKMFGRVLANPNLAVRLEALNIIARSKTEEVRQLVADCLGDPNAQMRIQAAKLLPLYDPQKAYMDLSRLVKTPDFEKRTIKEKVQVYGALGATLQQGALSHFASLLQHKSLFNKKKLAEDKLLAIAGLSQFPTIPSFKLLQAEGKNKGNPPEVAAAARRGMFAVKRELFGDNEEDV